MKLPAFQLKGFVAKGLSPFISALFYGEEDFFVSQKVSFLINKVLKLKSSDVSCVEGASLLSREVFLEDLLGTQTLWGESAKALWVQNASEKLLPILEDYLANRPSDAFVIVSGDKYLKPASKMRQHYESEATLLSIGCFPPNARDIKDQLSQMMTNAQKTMDAGLLAYLSELFVPCPMLLDSEITKLLTYVGIRQTITSEDVAACIVLDEVLDYDSLTHAFFTAQPSDTMRYLKEQLNQGGSAIGVVRMMLPYARRLYALHALQRDGKTFDQASMKVAPPIFSHQRAKFQEYLRNWGPEALQALLSILMQLEADCKRHSDIAHISCERGLLRGMLARKQLKTS